MEVVKLFLEKFDDPDFIFSKMREEAGLENYQPSGRWTPNDVKKYVARLCEFLGKPVPHAESRRLFISVAMEPTVASFLRSEMEAQDVIPIMEALTGDEPSAITTAIDFVKGKCRSLASFISEQLGRGPIPFETEFRPVCAPPNPALHALHNYGELVIRDKSRVKHFVEHLQGSRYFAMDFHQASDHDGVIQHLSIISFCFRKRIIFVFPKLFPETVDGVSRALMDNPKPVFVFKWDRRGAKVRELFGWTPPQLYEAEVVARRHGFPATLDAMAEEVVRGKFCRRASNFCADAVPSAIALEHRAIRVKLIYEFVVKQEKLRPPTEGPFQPRWPTISQPVGRQVGGKRETTGEDEETLPKRGRDSPHDDRAAGRSVWDRLSRRDDDRDGARGNVSDARRVVRR